MIFEGPNKSSKPRFTVSLNWKVCLFSLLLLPLLLWLGYWQLDRADEKRTIQQFAERQQALAPQSIANIVSDVEEGDALLYRRVQGIGLFETSKFWLIENQPFRGRNGFHVLVPFYLNSGQVLLVNRGWVQGTGYRDRLPEVSIPKGELTLVGQLVKPSDNTLLKQAESLQIPWPKTILQIDLSLMAMAFDKPLLPWVLQIDAEDPSALKVKWAIVNVPVEKHLGYAYQWFAMALALLVLTVFANTNLASVLRPPTKKD